MDLFHTRCVKVEVFMWWNAKENDEGALWEWKLCRMRIRNVCGGKKMGPKQSRGFEPEQDG